MLYDNKEFIGKVIKQARKNCGLTQEELAEKTNMAEKTISNIENGKQFPALNNFFRIFEILNLSLEDFGVAKPSPLEENKQKLIDEIRLANSEKVKIFREMFELAKKLALCSG